MQGSQKNGKFEKGMMSYKICGLRSVIICEIGDLLDIISDVLFCASLAQYPAYFLPSLACLWLYPAMTYWKMTVVWQHLQSVKSEESLFHPDGFASYLMLIFVIIFGPIFLPYFYYYLWKEEDSRAKRVLVLTSPIVSLVVALKMKEDSEIKDEYLNSRQVWFASNRIFQDLPQAIIAITFTLNYGLTTFGVFSMCVQFLMAILWMTMVVGHKQPTLAYHACKELCLSLEDMANVVDADGARGRRRSQTDVHAGRRIVPRAQKKAVSPQQKNRAQDETSANIIDIRDPVHNAFNDGLIEKETKRDPKSSRGNQFVEIVGYE